LKEYELPNPKEKPIAALVLSYKTLKGHEYDDRSWDKVNWGRVSKSAKLLIETCKDFTTSERCLSSLAAKFEDIGCDWTFETVLKHAHDWMQKNRGNSGTNARQRLFDAISKRRTEDKATQSGNLSSSGEILAGLRDMQIIPLAEPDDKTGTRTSHG